MERRREILINVILVFLSINIVFAGFEASLRIGLVNDAHDYTLEDRRENRIVCEGSENTIEFHQIYGHIHKSNSQYLHKLSTLDDYSLITTNSNGFRDIYDSGDENVLVFGDSFTFGSQVGDNETYTYLLDRWSSNTAFHNFGIQGYGTHQELLVYRDFSSNYSHDLVVLQYYMGNDMGNNVNNRSDQPQFKLINNTAVQVRGPVNRSTIKEKTKNDDEYGIIYMVLNNNIINNVQKLLDTHTEAYGYIAPRLDSLLKEYGIITTKAGEPPEPSEVQRQKNLTRALLDQFAAEANEHDAKLLIVSIPDRKEIKPNYYPDYIRPEAMSPYYDTQRSMLTKVTESHSNVHKINMKDKFERETGSGKRVYGEIDAHMNAYGHQLVAHEIYDWTRNHSYITDSENIINSTEYSKNINSCPT